MALLKDQEEYANIHYLICGRGEQWPALEAEARELGISDHVRFLGYRHDVPELCRCSDLFVFMTLREGLPVALMEAMSCGLPTICQNIRGNSDLIDDGVEGDFIANSPQAVADAMLAMYRDSQRRSRMGAAAAEKVKQFDKDNVHAQVKKIYLSA
jgi:glycosyltransferase EpsD